MIRHRHPLPVNRLFYLLLFFLLPAVLLSATATAETAETAETESYQLGPGDQIRITVFDEPSLSMEVRLDAKGVIAYPLLGDIQARGQSVKQLEKTVYQGLLGDFLVNPNVSISLVEYRPFFIAGEVNRPGGYPYQPGLTVARAVALAQGLTARGTLKKVYLISEQATSSQPVRVDSQTLLQPGDMITVRRRFF